MKRREFTLLFGGVAADFLLRRPLPARAQDGGNANAAAAAAATIGQVATLQGAATVTRAAKAGGAAAPAVALKVSDPIFINDVLATGADGSLGVTFDDETTFNLGANARIVVDSFVYEDGGGANAGLFTVARGTAAFVAGKLAKTGDMRIATPLAIMGVRGTTGIVEVPEGNAGAGGAGGEPRVKLYADADGHIGQIEVFDRQGTRLGALTQGASAFTLRAGPGGRLQALRYAIPAAESARDRGALVRLSAAHEIGRRMTTERRERRGNRQGPNRGGRPGGLNPRTPNERRGPGGPEERRGPRGPGGARPQGGGRNPGGKSKR